MKLPNVEMHEWNTRILMFRSNSADNGAVFFYGYFAHSLLPLKVVDFRSRCSLSAGQAVSHIRTFRISVSPARLPAGVSHLPLQSTIKVENYLKTTTFWNRMFVVRRPLWKYQNGEMWGKLVELSPEFPEIPLMLPTTSTLIPIQTNIKKKNPLRKSRFFSKLTLKNQK